MNILDTIKADYKTARFNNDGVSKSLLSTLIGDIQNTEKRLSKTLSDDDVIKSIKAFLKNIDQSLNVTKDINASIRLAEEKKILENYLPKMLSESEMIAVIKKHGLTTIKDAMNHFKSNFPNKFDAKFISQYIKNMA